MKKRNPTWIPSLDAEVAPKAFGVEHFISFILFGSIILGVFGQKKGTRFGFLP